MNWGRCDLFYPKTSALGANQMFICGHKKFGKTVRDWELKKPHRQQDSLRLARSAKRMRGALITQQIAETKQNFLTSDVGSGDPREAHSDARLAVQVRAVRFPRRLSLDLHTLQKRRQLSHRTARYPEAVHPNPRVPRHVGAASRRASDPIESWHSEYLILLFSPTSQAT